MSEKTETEQLFDDITAAETDEQPEEITDETPEDEEILTEEQLEEARKIAEYETEIEQLDAKLAEYEANSLAERKREEMRKVNYNDEQVERYLSHIEGETADEIKASVIEFTNEIPPPADIYGDPSAFNGAKEKPKTVDKKEVGRNAIKRVIDKIRL